MWFTRSNVWSGIGATTFLLLSGWAHSVDNSLVELVEQGKAADRRSDRFEKQVVKIIDALSGRVDQLRVGHSDHEARLRVQEGLSREQR